MIGEVCRFYSWTVDHALQMPAPRFFLMLESARKLKSTELAYLCYVSRSANMKKEAFDEVVAFFQGLSGPKEIPIAPAITQSPSLKASSPEAKNAVMDAFAKDHRINRSAQPRNKPTQPKRRP